MESVAQFVGLAGLAILYYGGMIYPPLSWPLAVFNLAFLAACMAVFAARGIERLIQISQGRIRKAAGRFAGRGRGRK